MNELNETSLPEKGRFTFEKDDKTMLVKFPLMFAETESNGRTYPKEILAAAVADLKSRIAKRKSSFAATGHKDMGVDDVAAVLEDVEMVDKTVYATARVLDTVKGANVRSILKHGAIGVSAKGRGDLDANHRVKPGYVLNGFDWTLDPAFGTFVGRSNILESCSVEEDNELAKAKGFSSIEALDEAMKAEGLTEVDVEKTLRLKFISAQAAGFQGDMKDFRASFNRILADRDTEMKFDDAVKNAGYKGTLAQYRAAHLIK